MDVNVLDYGAYLDDTHEAETTLAFKNALNAIRATGGRVLVPYGIYRIAPSGIMGVNGPPCLTDGMSLIGIRQAGHNPLLKVHNKQTWFLIHADGYNTIIQYISIDLGNFYPDPIPGQGGLLPAPVLFIGSKTGQKLLSCQLINVTAFAVLFFGGSYFTIDNVYVLCNTPSSNPPKYGIYLSNIGNNICHHGTITNNYIDGCSLGGNMKNTLLRGNGVTNAGWNAGIWTGDIRTGNRDNTFIGNACWSSSTNIHGFNLNSQSTFFFGNLSYQNGGYGVITFGNRVVFAFNSIWDNGTTAHHKYGLVINTLEGGEMRQYSSSNSLFFANWIQETRQGAARTQDYGIVVPSELTRSVSFIENQLYGHVIADAFYFNCQPDVKVDKGQDLFRVLQNTKQRELLRECFDRDKFTLTDQQYILLNQLFTGSSLGRAG